MQFSLNIFELSGQDYMSLHGNIFSATISDRGGPACQEASGE